MVSRTEASSVDAKGHQTRFSSLRPEGQTPRAMRTKKTYSSIACISLNSLNKRIANYYYNHQEGGHSYNYSAVSSFFQKLKIPPFAEICPEDATKQPKIEARNLPPGRFISVYLALTSICDVWICLDAFHPLR